MEIAPHPDHFCIRRKCVWLSWKDDHGMDGNHRMDLCACLYCFDHVALADLCFDFEYSFRAV